MGRGFGAGLLIGLLGGFRGCCCGGGYGYMPRITDTTYAGSSILGWQARYMDMQARSSFGYSQFGGYGMPIFPAMALPDEDYWNNWYKKAWEKNTDTSNSTNRNSSQTKAADTDGDGEVSFAEETAYEKFKSNFADVYNVLGAYYATNDKTKYSTELRTVLEKFKNTTTPTQDDYANLKSVYLKISRDTSEGKKLSRVFESLRKEDLEIAGHKFTRVKNANDTVLKNKLDKLELELSSLNETTDYTSETFENLINFNKDDESGLGDDILRVISYWNDTRTGDNERSIIRLINTKIPEKKEQCEYAVKKLVQPLTESLMNRANELASDLDGAIATQLAEQKTTVFNALKTVLDKHCKGTDSKKDVASLNTLANEFEKLYKMCRLAEAQRINQEIKAEYGFINDLATDDKDLVTDTILNDTIADLEAEGLKDVKVEIELNPVVEEDGVEDDGNNDEDPGANPPGANPPGANPPETQRVEGLDNNCLVPLADMYEGQEIFRLADCMGKNDLYVIKDGKLRKVINLEYKDGEFKVKEGETVKYQEVNVAGLQAEYETALDKAKEEEAEEVTQTEANKMKDNGKEVYRVLNDWTTKDYAIEVNTILSGITENNVLSFLEGYYNGEANLAENKNWRQSKEGLIEHLDDDNAGGKIEYTNKKKLVNAIIAKADSLELDKDAEYKDAFEELVSIMELHTTGRLSNAEDFGSIRSDARGWGSRIIRGKDTYNERMDELIEKLYKGMRAKIATQNP